MYIMCVLHTHLLGGSGGMPPPETFCSSEVIFSQFQPTPLLNHEPWNDCFIFVCRPNSLLGNLNSRAWWGWWPIVGDISLSTNSANSLVYCSQTRGHAHATKSGNEYLMSSKKSAAAIAAPAAAAPTALHSVCAIYMCAHATCTVCTRQPLPV